MMEMEARSFASRRPAATSLPAFTLPPPDIPRVAGDGLSPSSGIHTGSSQSSQPGGGAGGSMYYQTNLSGNWATGTPGSSSSAYTFANPGLGGQHSAGSLNPSSGLMPGSSFQNNRSLFGNGSPNLPHFGGSRASHSPANGDNLPQPPSYQGHSPFPTGIGGGPALPPTLPSQAQHGGPPVTAHPMPQSILSSQGPPAVSQAATPPSVGIPSGPPPNSHHPLPSPNSSYYPSASTPQTNSFPTFTTGPPSHHQSSLAGGPGNLPNSSSAASLRGLSTGMAPPMGYPTNRSHYQQGYGVPNGPVLANLHSPGAPLTIVGGPMMGGYHHAPPGHSPLPPQIYGPGAHGHPPPHHGPGSTHDRPFKCDTCPQSFNRNHDLKRHKRIHLAVKPYPCSYCEKSFSRKDALKRHRLVKGCGEKAENEPSSTPAPPPDMSTPPDRTDGMSDGTEDSPNVKPEKN